MISYQTYLLVHIFGILLVFLALGGRATHAASGGTRRGPDGSSRLTAATHGVGLFLILLGGFGLLARIGVQHGLDWPGWVWTKMAIWLALGVALALPYRFPALARPLWVLLPILGLTAAYMAVFKPF